MTIQRQLGPTVRAIRIERGLSQEQVALAAGLDRSYLGEIERGLKSPTLVTLEKIARSFGLRASELVSQCEPPPPLGEVLARPAEGNSP